MKMQCVCNNTKFQELLETELMYVTDLEQAATYITYMRNSKEAEEADIRSLTLSYYDFIYIFSIHINRMLYVCTTI